MSGSVSWPTCAPGSAAGGEINLYPHLPRIGLTTRQQVGSGLQNHRLEVTSVIHVQDTSGLAAFSKQPCALEDRMAQTVIAICGNRADESSLNGCQMSQRCYVPGAKGARGCGGIANPTRRRSDPVSGCESTEGVAHSPACGTFGPEEVVASSILGRRRHS